VATTCPVLWDILGFSGFFGYLPGGTSIYLTEPTFKKLSTLRIGTGTNVQTSRCLSRYRQQSSVGCERSARSRREKQEDYDWSWSQLQSYQLLVGIRLTLGKALDMVLISNGTLLMIQNMTWNGAQGFTSKPSDPFYVRPATFAASGVLGTTHTERGLTWVSVNLSGHNKFASQIGLSRMLTLLSVIPQYTPSASYRHLEFLLGRIDPLSSTFPFTIDSYPQPNVPSLGNGTAPPTKKHQLY
jgi:carboxypeptidase D